MSDMEEEFHGQKSCNDEVAVDVEVYTCKGEGCKGNTFLRSTVGSSVTLELCPACNDALKQELEEGKCLQNNFCMNMTFFSHCMYNALDTDTKVCSGLPLTEEAHQQGDEAPPPPPEEPSNDQEGKEDNVMEVEQLDEETSSTSPAVVHEVPPANQNILRGMLSVLVTSLDEDDFISVHINDKDMKLKRCDLAASIQPGTRHFTCVGVERKKLYWYTEYAAVMTSQNMYVENCMLSSGDVIAGVWETRCNRPFRALLLCTASSGYKDCH